MLPTGSERRDILTPGQHEIVNQFSMVPSFVSFASFARNHSGKSRRRRRFKGDSGEVAVEKHHVAASPIELARESREYMNRVAGSEWLSAKDGKVRKDGVEDWDYLRKSPSDDAEIVLPLRSAREYR
jgi:hypothetical protein